MLIFLLLAFAGYAASNCVSHIRECAQGDLKFAIQQGGDDFLGKLFASEAKHEQLCRELHRLKNCTKTRMLNCPDGDRKIAIYDQLCSPDLVKNERCRKAMTELTDKCRPESAFDCAGVPLFIRHCAAKHIRQECGSASTAGAVEDLIKADLEGVIFMAGTECQG